MNDDNDEKPRITARPIGSRFAVRAKGLEHRRGDEKVSDSFIACGDGCYRRPPAQNSDEQ